MVISSIVMGRLAVVDGLPIIVAFPAGLLTGVACGFLNGSLVTRLKMPPFIVTLGTWSIIGALNTFYSQSETIRSHDLEAYAPFLQMMGVTFNVAGARIMLGTARMRQQLSDFAEDCVGTLGYVRNSHKFRRTFESLMRVP